jgi:ubiquitin-protein ligase E3 B
MLVAHRTLSQLRLEILTGLSFGDLMLKPLWIFVNSLGPTCGLKPFLELFHSNRAANAPEFQMLTLFCDTFR